jgi:ankyrin repeat protein
MIEHFLAEACGWASEADKAVLRALVEYCVRIEGETEEYSVLCLRNSMKNYEGGYEPGFVRNLAGFLESKKDVSELDRELERAITAQDLELARALVGQGVSMNDGCWRNGFLLIDIASSYTEDALWIIDHARELKVDLDIQDRFEWEWKEDHIPGFREDVASYLDIEDRLGWQQGPHLRNTPLILAMKKGWDHIDTQYDPSERERPPPRMGNVIAALAGSGVKLDTQDGCGNTALHIAMLHREAPAVRLLLKHGARLDIRNNAGLLPADMLAVPYEDIPPFLYQQTGNDVNDYIHTLLEEDDWIKARPAVEALIRVPERNAAAVPALNL